NTTIYYIFTMVSGIIPATCQIQGKTLGISPIPLIFSTGLHNISGVASLTGQIWSLDITCFYWYAAPGMIEIFQSVVNNVIIDIIGNIKGVTFYYWLSPFIYRLAI